MPGIFDSIECKSCVEKIKINSECYFVGLQSNRLICKCKESKEEWKRPVNELIKNFPSIYQFCNDDLNKFVFSLRKGIYPMKIWIIRKKFMKPHYHLKKLFIVI